MIGKMAEWHLKVLKQLGGLASKGSPVDGPPTPHEQQELIKRLCSTHHSQHTCTPVVVKERKEKTKTICGQTKGAQFHCDAVPVHLMRILMQLSSLNPPCAYGAAIYAAAIVLNGGAC